MAASPTAPSTHRIRVVVADDEAPVRALLGITLSMERDFQVVGEAADGAEAVEMIIDRHPDAVVLDLMMPMLAGLEAIPKIRECCPDCRIVVFSALSADQAEGDALSRGADAYVEKTRFVTELCDTLHRVCDKTAA
jgi:DNA-binding NarL/FixJ family response regulator